jgi:peptide deformylase
MKILLWPHPTLKEVSQPYPTDDLAKALLQRRVTEMFGVMKAAGGVGLSAVQVGDLSRFFILDAGNGPEVLVNPHTLITTGDRVPMMEGCLSTPGQFEIVWRHPEVTISYLDGNMVPQTTTATGLRAQAIQHELEHLDGHIFVEHLKAADRGRVLGAMMKMKKSGK